ncbi:Serine-threonine protein kinase [Golovinomyces cichoracearum]|uniref:non-specific serine/threonine protein kinase n=1 Tax=Golovinomyces cichoracearum TaxID=62708 RepID=A0A420HE34_9PEZI|nr:Serine-threonine protein kinase [Golovinomyces cichoracearum]
MNSYNPVIPVNAPRPTYGAPITTTDFQAPAGTFVPGTKIQVGSQKVVIQKYLSEGGFAHVYLVKMPKPIDGTEIAVLKRVAVPDKEHLASMRTEVETMKKLKGHRPIVTYYDSHASQLKGGGYEVFLLMEYCNGGGLIDFMNTRLQNRLTEPEVLNIFSDVAEGVACMHYLKPSLLHRDLKVENVLITTKNGTRRFKLCDFGSTATPRPAATTAAECRQIVEDIQKHTTLQYRSPEMVDVYRKLSIDEKSDIWALGVLLYKLCFYTTPFEAQGQLAILNASFTFPDYPIFSDKLKALIASMLKESPHLRPNIYQVLREACSMQGLDISIKDIYGVQDPTDSKDQEKKSSNKDNFSPSVGVVFSPPSTQKIIIPDVVPMRRGRPAPGKVQKSNIITKTQDNINDPWATLDSTPQAMNDNILTRFPSLDKFSFLQSEGRFDFDKNLSKAQQDLKKKTTERTADDAFLNQSVQSVSKAQEIISNNPELQATSSSVAYKSMPIPLSISTQTEFQNPSSSYVSQGTMTSTSPLKSLSSSNNSKLSSDHHHVRAVSHNQEIRATLEQTDIPFLKTSVQISQTSSTSPSSPENIHPSSSEGPSRTKSTNSRTPRTYLESNIEFLREKELKNQATFHSSTYLRSEIIESSSSSDSDGQCENTRIESNITLLQHSETKKKDRNQRSYSSETKSKRTSLPSTGTKTLLAGKFGDAFKRFEHSVSHQISTRQSRTPSPLNVIEHDSLYLKPISNSGVILDEISSPYATNEESIFDAYTERLPPEQRREIERRRMSIEEKRVADAAVEYRKRFSDREVLGLVSPKVSPSATTIQNKVRSLLDENRTRPQSLKKTALHHDTLSGSESLYSPIFSRNPYAVANNLALSPKKSSEFLTHGRSPRDVQQNSGYQEKGRDLNLIPERPIASKTGNHKPSAPPKPFHLNHMVTGNHVSTKSHFHQPDFPKTDSDSNFSKIKSGIEISDSFKEKDFLSDFSERFPSLSGIEMVEREINARSEEKVREGIDASKSYPGVWRHTEQAGARSKDV